jgi:hypothetical protein
MCLILWRCAGRPLTQVNQLKEALEPSAPASGNSPASPGVSGSSMQGSVLVQSAVEELELVFEE